MQPGACLGKGNGMTATISSGMDSSAALSDGEIYFLWWFIQGAIMSSATRVRLHKGWGMCERHAWGFIQVEAAFREDYLHGPSILYDDLMQRARTAIAHRGPGRSLRTVHSLQPKGPCLLCEMQYKANSRAPARPELICQGAKVENFRKFVQATASSWRPVVCGVCAANNAVSRCRRHLLDDIRQKRVTDLEPHVELVAHIARHMRRYALSFRYENRATDTDADRAALVCAVGWCSGWRPLLSLMGF